MVKIVNYKERLREDNSSFYVLEVQGGIELVKSQSTGNYYATSKRRIFQQPLMKFYVSPLIGQELEGSIVRQECKPYSYVVKDTGEELTLRHRWVFTPEKEQAVIQKQETNDALFMPVNAFNISDQQAYPS